MVYLRYLPTIALIFLYISSAIAYEKTNGNCPPLWTKFQNHCYRFYGGPMNWEAAEQHCRESFTCNGGATAHLVSIHNQDENSFLYDYWQSSLIAGCTNQNARLDGFWIGLNDRETEGTMAWSDNTSVDFVFWKPNEPNNGGAGEDCIHMVKSSSDTVGDKWNDTECPDHSMPFICKMPID